MINKNILHIIVDNVALQRWKNMISKINNEYHKLYSFDKKKHCTMRYNNFAFNYRNMEYEYRIEEYTYIFTISKGFMNPICKIMPKYYFYSNRSEMI